MKKTLLAILISSSLFAEISPQEYKPAPFYDFGEVGKTYPIAERNIVDEIKEEFKKFKLTKEEFKEAAEKGIEKLANYNTALPLCTSTMEFEAQEDVSILEQDIKNGAGVIVKQKGEPIVVPLPQGAEFSLCYISGKNYINGLNEIKYLNDSVKSKKCIFLVSDRDVRDYRKAFPLLDIYPSSTTQESRFGVKCYPSKIDLYGIKRQLSEFDYRKFNN